MRAARGLRGAGGAQLLQGGEVGLILDCRGRPIAIPDQDAARAAKMREWLKALNLRSE